MIAGAVDEAAQRARAGGGPTFIEAVTYRMSLHTTADDPTVYREEDLVDPWEERCPLRRFETYMKYKELLDGPTIEKIHAECEQEVIEARDRFRSTAASHPREIFDHLYEQLPEELEAQRDAYLRRLDGRGGSDA